MIVVKQYNFYNGDLSLAGVEDNIFLKSFPQLESALEYIKEQMTKDLPKVIYEQYDEEIDVKETLALSQDEFEDKYPEVYFEHADKGYMLINDVGSITCLVKDVS